MHSMCLLHQLAIKATAEIQCCFIYQEQKFVYLGQLIAVSIIQAKTTYPFFSKAAFQYICGKRINEIDYTVLDVADSEIRAIVEKVINYGMHLLDTLFIAINLPMQDEIYIIRMQKSNPKTISFGEKSKKL